MKLQKILDITMRKKPPWAELGQVSRKPSFLRTIAGAADRPVIASFGLSRLDFIQPSGFGAHNSKLLFLGQFEFDSPILRARLRRCARRDRLVFPETRRGQAIRREAKPLNHIPDH